MNQAQRVATRYLRASGFHFQAEVAYSPRIGMLEIKVLGTMGHRFNESLDYYYKVVGPKILKGGMEGASAVQAQLPGSKITDIFASTVGGLLVVMEPQISLVNEFTLKMDPQQLEPYEIEAIVRSALRKFKVNFRVI